MTNSLKFKRFIAYFIDLLIISFLVTLLAKVNFINPMHTKYQKTVNDYLAYNEKIQKEYKQEEKIDSDLIVNDEYINLVYHMDYYGSSYLITEIIVFICYFTILPFFNNGQTFGKEFLKITVVNQDDSKTGLGKYLLRVLILPIYANVFIYNSLRSIIQVILVFAVKPKPYFYANIGLILLFSLFCYADVLFYFLSKKDLTLHDKLLKTKVVNYVRTK